jgi:hypothetical protein
VANRTVLPSAGEGGGVAFCGIEGVSEGVFMGTGAGGVGERQLAGE